MAEPGPYPFAPCYEDNEPMAKVLGSERRGLYCASHAWPAAYRFVSDWAWHNFAGRPDTCDLMRRG